MGWIGIILSVLIDGRGSVRWVGGELRIDAYWGEE
jgi:hypothetical protein